MLLAVVGASLGLSLVLAGITWTGATLESP
jgi:hypothetical protein